MNKLSNEEKYRFPIIKLLVLAILCAVFYLFLLPIAAADFALRIPSIVFYIIYTVFCSLIVSRTKRIPELLVLCLAAFLLTLLFLRLFGSTAVFDRFIAITNDPEREGRHIYYTEKFDLSMNMIGFMSISGLVAFIRLCFIIDKNENEKNIRDFEVPNETMTEILSIYHSGVGNTKFVSEKITGFLQNEKIAVENYSVESFDKEKIKNYEYLIIGFPTYYTKNSKVMSDFIDKLPRYEKRKYAFIYTTCGLFSGNALYDFAKKLRKKNIYVSHSAVYRCPATDFALIMPSFKPTLTFEKDLLPHIKWDLKCAIYGFCKHRNIPPKFRLYSIFYTPLQALERKNMIKINHNLCTGCGKCVRNCPHNCFEKAENGIIFDIKNCENCYRCIHHCPARALSINGKVPKIVFDDSFFTE